MASLIGQQSVAIGLRDLIVVGMDFREGQKAVAIAAIVDESRLKRGLHAGDFGQIDVAAKLFLRERLEIKLLDAIATLHHHTGLFPVGGID
jgi:hypothetical protein